jgi:hypothetical protein
MNRSTFSALALAVAALSSVGAQAADGSLSRDQVRAELAQAQRNGDLLAAGEAGLPQNQVNPAAYGAQPAAGVSREAVQAELAQYRREGVNPWAMSYNPLKSFKGTASRADVSAQYVESRDRVAAFTGEDSGSSYLASNDRAVAPGATRLAGTPVSGN